MCSFDKNQVESLYDEAGEKFDIETERLPPGMIAQSKELNLFMMRFWNLYDSMFYSNYMTAKLKLWHEEGYKQLERLIARVGVPIKEARQKFQFISSSYKRNLKNQILDISQKEGLNL